MGVSTPMAGSNPLAPWDAYCHHCGRVHIIYAPAAHRVGDEVVYEHEPGVACGVEAKHTLLERLDGLWG